MERIDRYLDLVPLPVVGLAVVMAIMLFLMFPARKRMIGALFLLPICLTLARMPDLGMFQLVSKVVSSALFLLLAVSAGLYPGPKRRLHPAVWIFPIMAAVSFIYIMTVTDRATALALRLQWLLLTIAAIMLCRLLVNAEAVRMVVYSVAAGCIAACVLPMTHLIMNPGEALSGFGRFFPFGANPNQIGALFGITVPLTVYLAYRARSIGPRVFFLGVASAAVAMGILTASRGTVLVMAGATLPLILVLSRRPIVTVTGLAVVFFGISLVLGAAESNLSRLGSLESERFTIFMQYLEVIAQRPAFGLLGTQGESWAAADAIRTNTHNTYLHMLYLGGLSYFVPMAIVFLMAVASTLRVWKSRALHDVDPLLTSTLAAYLGILFAHGMFGMIINHPTYTASFMFVLLCCHFITTDLGMRRGEFILSEHGHEYDESEAWWEPEGAELQPG